MCKLKEEHDSLKKENDCLKAEVEDLKMENMHLNNENQLLQVGKFHNGKLQRKQLIIGTYVDYLTL